MWRMKENALTDWWMESLRRCLECLARGRVACWTGRAIAQQDFDVMSDVLAPTWVLEVASE